MGYPRFELKIGWLGVVDDFRTAKWAELVPYPGLVLSQSKELLSSA